jgi:hypothetical protein
MFRILVMHDDLPLLLANCVALCIGEMETYPKPQILEGRVASVQVLEISCFPSSLLMQMFKADRFQHHVKSKRIPFEGQCEVQIFGNKQTRRSNI